MWFAATLVDAKPDEKGKKSKLRVVINTDLIRMLVENKADPNTSLVQFLDDTPSCLIEGSYESNAKIFYSLNRK